MAKEIVVSLVSATLLSITPGLQVLPFAQEAGKNILRLSSAYGITPQAQKIAAVTPEEQTLPPAGQSTPLQTVPTAPRKRIANPQPAAPTTTPPEKPLRQAAQGSTGNSRPTVSSPQTSPGQPRPALAQAQGSQPEEPRSLQRQSSKLSLTLEQSIELALQRNLRVQIATLSRDAVSYEVPRTKALFHPTVGASFLASGEKLRPELAPNVDTNTQSVSPFISQLVPTGATVVVSNDFTRHETAHEDPPRTYDSAVTVSVVQPLLRGGWPTVVTRPIRDAEFGVRIEEARLRAEILRIVAQAKSAYYTAILHEKIIAITEEAIQRDKTLIESSQALFQAGLVTKRDVFSAEVILSKDLARLANAQADLATARNALLDVLGISIAIEVDLLDKALSFQPLLPEPELARWIAAAIGNRPEVLEVEERLGQSELNIRVTRNTTLPQLDLVAAYGKPHTASTFKRSLDLRGETWSAGLLFSVPIGNVAARSALTQAEIEQKRLQQELVQVQRQIELEVRTAVIKLRKSLELMRVRSIGIEQAQGKLEVAQARFALGQADNFDVTDAQQDLLEAQTDLLTATADYNIGLAELEASIAEPVMSAGAVR